MSFIKQLMEQQFEDDLQREQTILVPGIGVMRIENAEQRVRGMLTDLAQRVNNSNVDWHQINMLVNNSGLHAYLQALEKLNSDS